MALPAAPAPATAAPGDSDHDAVVGTIGIGYLGAPSIPVGVTGAPVAVLQSTIQAPVIGVRYWLDPTMGLDLGLGIGIQSFSASGPDPATGTGSRDIAAPSFTAFLIHGGVPFALASSQHFAFEVIPELNVGFGNGSVDIQDATGATIGTQSASGLHLDLGARAGAEIHFGFMGLPRLALQGTVGLAFGVDNVKSENKPNAGATTTFKQGLTSFGTTVQDSPWSIFRSNVAALYYF
jgi:hypothetical protein